jgi:uncharacterized protein YbbC (DUF1343 family)
MNKLFSFLLLAMNIFFLQDIFSCTQKSSSSIATKRVSQKDSLVITGAMQMDNYLPKLKNKRIALVVNHTSLVENTHLADTLLAHKVNIVKIFAPEHGFRGMADAGEHVKNEIDVKTGLPIISLYGKNKKPTNEQLANIDLVIFDIQDVGARFYTYIGTMHYIMEAAAENNIKVLILDRPNPNGYYVDGPILEDKFKSFVGMHPVPIVHGLTVGEYAQMINGEKWLENGLQADIEVIKIKNYSHKDLYHLPIKPSPNLPNDLSISLYPSLCLFEGTNISIARGTTFPFQAIGYPDKKFGTFSFTPKSIDGMAKNPPLENKLCYGIDFRTQADIHGLSLEYLIKYYNLTSDKNTFFSNFFNTLAGNNKLMEQIKAGKSESEIRKTWQPELNEYKVKRKKYLLYPDFE